MRDDLPAEAASFLGESLARWWALRQVSLCVARLVDEGQAPALEAAISKDLGTQFEQQVIARIQTLVDLEPSPEAQSAYERLLARRSPEVAFMGDPGGNERDLENPDLEGAAMTDRLLLETAERVFADTSTYDAVQEAQRSGWAPAIWQAVAQVGLPWISVPEAAGGVVRHAQRRRRRTADRRAGMRRPSRWPRQGCLAGWLLAASGSRSATARCQSRRGAPKTT